MSHYFTNGVACVDTGNEWWLDGAMDNNKSGNHTAGVDGIGIVQQNDMPWRHRRQPRFM